MIRTAAMPQRLHCTGGLSTAPAPDTPVLDASLAGKSAIIKLGTAGPRRTGAPTMSISFQLPDDIERALRRELGDLDQVAKEAAMVELFRQGKLSQGKFAECLGISRYEADGVLKRHHVTEDLLTIEELDKQVADMRELLGR